jgi:hypothetical protein
MCTDIVWDPTGRYVTYLFEAHTHSFNHPLTLLSVRVMIVERINVQPIPKTHLLNVSTFINVQPIPKTHAR